MHFVQERTSVLTLAKVPISVQVCQCSTKSEREEKGAIYMQITADIVTVPEVLYICKSTVCHLPSSLFDYVHRVNNFDLIKGITLTQARIIRQAFSFLFHRLQLQED